jgi:hypothetical protein
MPALQFGLSSYERGRGDMPELPVINLFAEEAPTESGGVVLQSRPGLEDRSADMGSGPTDCLFQRDLVLDSALFGVAFDNGIDASLYEGATRIGTLDGPGPFSMAGYETVLFAAGGARLWTYDGTTLASVSFPDSADVLKVIVGASRAICLRADTGKFYWSDSLESDIEALDFATAENQPDRTLDCLFLDDFLILFGKETIEFWSNTSVDALPFQPLEGRVIEKGIRATGCAAVIGPTFAWVTNEHQVCLGDETTIISKPGLEEKIEASAECRLFTFPLGGIEFLALRIDDETHVWSQRSQLWSEFQSYGEDNWLAHCFAGGAFGSAIDGRTAEWSSGHEDFGGVLERRFRAGFWGVASVFVANLLLRCNVGQTPYLSGDYTTPSVEMRVSWDNGRTWGNWRSASLGEQGGYGVTPVWRALGMMRRWKAFLAEFRVTAPVDWRVSAALLNEPYGGR